MLLLSLFLPLWSLAAESPAQHEWREWRDKEFADFRKNVVNNPFALQEVTELRAGEEASLPLAPGVKKPRFVKGKAAAGPVATFRFNGKKATLSAPGEERGDLLKSTWKKSDDLVVNVSGRYGDKVRLFLYHGAENFFRPALMPFFPFAERFVVKATLDRSEARPVSPVADTQGGTREYALLGVAHFPWEGKDQALKVYAPDPTKPREFFVPFRDATNGKATYGGGRYVEGTLARDSSEELTLDFNRAYNPYCAYNHYFNCPLVSGNELSFAVTAGAKLPPKK